MFVFRTEQSTPIVASKTMLTIVSLMRMTDLLTMMTSQCHDMFTVTTKRTTMTMTDEDNNENVRGLVFVSYDSRF